MTRLQLAGLTAATLAAVVTVAPAFVLQDNNQPPAGFTPVFNGKDLAGWHGMPHFDPRDLAKMEPAKREAQIAEWTADAKKHWSIKDGALVNDGDGAYLTTDKEYGDMEFYIDYKTVAKADSGIYLRGTPPGSDLGLDP